MKSKREDLQARWNELYRSQLPTLAKKRDPVQQRWPVYLDHCFARIVLDNAVGQDRPWTEVVKQPAVKHMTDDQLQSAIRLAGKIAAGEANLDDLNNRSLELRGKKQPKNESVQETSEKKRKADGGREGGMKKQKQRREDGDVSSYFLPSPSKSPTKPKQELNDEDTQATETKGSTADEGDVDMAAQIQRIEDSNLTPFRKQALNLLCQIPRGRYSTYQALSDYITRSSHKTCARAVGSAMRNNPFAPEVPCHRILANDGSLGGFSGSWGENGKFASQKHELLHKEGVRFDSKRKVKGPPFRDFTA